MAKIKAYKQDSIWVADVNGFKITLHHSHTTRQSVIEWAEEQYPGYDVVFE